MAWIPMLLPFIVMVVLMLAPGVAVSLALGQRGLRATYLSPLISVAMVAGLAVIYGRVGIGFSAGTILGGSAVFVIVLAAIRFLLTRPRHRSFWFTPTTSAHSDADASYFSSDSNTGDLTPRTHRRNSILAVIGGLAISFAVWVFEYARPMGTPENFPQPYDVPFHFSVVKYLIETNNGSSLTSALVDRTVGSTFYPAAWHDFVALVVKAADTSIPVSAAASCSVLLMIVWPLSIMGLTIELLGHHPRWVFLSLSFSSLFAAFPYRFVNYGVLYSNLQSYAVLPAFMAFVVFCFISWKAPLEEYVSRVLLILLGFAGIALAQPNSVFTIVVLMFPFIIYLFVKYSEWIRQPLLRIGAIVLVSIAFTYFCVRVWLHLYELPSLQRTVTFEWPPFQSTWMAVHYYVLGGVNGNPHFELVGAFLLILGIMYLLRKRHPASWIIAGWAFMGFFYVITSATKSDFRDILTGFWYHDSNRLIAAGPMLAIPLACVGTYWLLTWITGKLPARIPQWSTLVVLVLVITILVGLSPTQRFQRSFFHDLTRLSQRWQLQDDEYEFLERIAPMIPDDVEVANDPYDGSAYAYSLFDIDVYFKDYDANWIGTPTEDIDVIRHQLDNVATDPEVCTVLNKYDIEYYIQLDRNAINDGSGVGVYDGNWDGYDIDSSTPGFELVTSDDAGNALYQITACS